MSFAGVSYVGGGRCSAGATTTVTDSGYHLLVVDGYSRTKEFTPNGEYITSQHFRVGGYRWVIDYYPNGVESKDADFISLHLCLDDYSVEETVKAQYKFSFVDKSQKQVPSEISASKVYNFKGNGWGYNSFMKREALEKSTHLKDDSLTIKCDIVVTKDVNAAAAPSFVVVPASDMHHHFASLLHSGEGTDVTFEVGGEIFAAHRCVLAARSTVFKAELLGPMKEGTTTASVIRMDDMEARVFKLLLGFVYSDSVPVMEEEEDDVMWQHLLVAANRYGLPRLRLICEDKLRAYISTSSVATILALAELHHCRGLKEECLRFLSSPANLQDVLVLGVGGLNHLTSSCPSALKEVIAKLVSQNFGANTGDTDIAALPFVEVPASDMHRHFTSLLRHGEGTDVTFEVGGEIFAVHRCVLAARSTVFRAELLGPMKEGTTTSVIRIEDMEAKVFKLLLSFIYSDSTPDIEEEDDDSTPDIEEEEEEEDDSMPDIEEEDDDEYDDHDDDNDVQVMWQHLLVAADRYDLQRMRLICEEKLCGYINASTVATILALAEQHHCRGLKEASLDFLNSPENLQEVMAAGGLDHLKSSCPSVLIDLIAKLASLKQDK